jgi:hypothetical protein
MKLAGLFTRLIAFEKAVEIRKVACPAGIVPKENSGGGVVEGPVEEGGGTEAFRLLPQTVQKVASSAFVAPHLLHCIWLVSKFIAL